MSDSGPPPDAPILLPKKAAKRAPTAGSWKPGVSPNPAGRPKTDPVVREALALGGMEAVAELRRIIRECPEDRTKCTAARNLLDFAVARPVAETESQHVAAEAVIDALAKLLTQPRGT